VYDFFATGDSLFNSHAYNLQLGYTETPLTFDPVSGCTLAGAAGASFAQVPQTDSTTVDRVDRITIATLVLLCVCAVLLVGILVFIVIRARKSPAVAKPEFTPAAVAAV